jgi:hypothetical protein
MTTEYHKILLLYLRGGDYLEDPGVVERIILRGIQKVGRGEGLD